MDQEIELLLTTNPDENLPKTRDINEIKALFIEKCRNKNELSIRFENKVTVRDSNFVLEKKKQFKQKEFEKIFNSTMEVLESFPNHLLGYLFAGATAFKDRDNKNSATFYLSCAVLVNPNCLTAWEGLLKHYRDNIAVSNVVIETIYYGYLLNERNLLKWQSEVLQLLSSDISYSSRSPLPILAPFLQQLNHCEDSKKRFVGDLLSRYLFLQSKNIENSPKIDDNLPQLAVEAFVIYCGNLKERVLGQFYYEALTFLFRIGAYTYINKFISCTMNKLRILSYYNIDFLISIIHFLMDNNLDRSYKLIRKFTDIITLTNLLDQRGASAQVRFISTVAFKSYGDHRRICDYGESCSKDERVLWKQKILLIWSYINLQEFEMAWAATLSSLSENVLLYKQSEHKMLCQLNAAHLPLNICLYLLTHGHNELMRKLGLLLCLKLINKKFITSEILFFTCVASISLNEDKIVTYCINKLSRLGFFDEVLFLKSLFEESYALKTKYLKELQDVNCSHLYTAILSNKFEKESKVVKSFCKASVMVPDSVFLYEWLGIYYYENNELSKSKLYFEIALFYNSHSWTSINYYTTLLALEDQASCKLFLTCYDDDRIKLRYLTFFHLFDIKAGLLFYKSEPTRKDQFRACDYFRRCFYRYPQSRYYKEMLAESYSKFGMFGSALKLFKECYLINKLRHLYSGTQLARQYLFVNGTTKYLKMMKCLVNNGGKDVFIVLYNTAHAFLVKSIQLSEKKHFFMSQIYCQEALFFCVRALCISTNFSCVWKLVGDVLFQCSCLGYSAGFLYIPHWLLPEFATSKVILIRRFQAILLAIRCYYAGMNTEFCSKGMSVCLWSSIGVAFRKLSFLSNKDNKQKILNFGVLSSVHGIKINQYDSICWNVLGVLIYSQGLKNNEVSQNISYIALKTSIMLRTPVSYLLFSSSNAGFAALSMFDYEKAYNLFLATRGTCTSLDIPWLGHMLINILVGNISDGIQNIVYIYLLTNHFPSLRILFTCLQLLSPFSSELLICTMAKKYKHIMDTEYIDFRSYFLSGMIKSQEKKHMHALTDFIFAVRTCKPMDYSDHAIYNSLVNELYLCLHNNNLNPTLVDAYYSLDQSGSLLLSEAFLDQNRLESAYFQLLKKLKIENNLNTKMVIYYLLSIINYKGNQNSHSKYYFLKGLICDNRNSI